MTATFHVGDAIEVMGKLPEKSVDLILTSPPFLALRSYLPTDHPDKAVEGGSQATPGLYIDWLVDVVEACARVLAPHGSMCIELGDTYAGSGGAGGDYDPGGWREDQEKYRQNKYERAVGEDFVDPDGRAIPRGVRNLHGKKQGGGSGWPLAKSLSLIPELFRLTLVYGINPLTGRTTERWRLRNVVRWVRPNPPVGALGDKFRPATSELMVFCKSAKRYFDLDAVREPYSERFQRGIDNGEKRGSLVGAPDEYAMKNFPKGMSTDHAGAPPLDWWNIPLLEGEEETRYGPKSEATKRDEFNAKYRAPGGFYPSAKQEGGIPERGDKGASNFPPHELGAPPLDWWEIPPGGYEGAHYAVFPPELCVKPIKAMCPSRVCRVCGAPSRRIVEYGGGNMERDELRHERGWNQRNPKTSVAERVTSAKTLGFSDCGHGDFRPGMVLDPFGGSGTTALVATGHGRDCILIDLDERNWDLALERVGPFILTLGNVDD